MNAPIPSLARGMRKQLPRSLWDYVNTRKELPRPPMTRSKKTNLKRLVSYYTKRPLTVGIFADKLRPGQSAEVGRMVTVSH